VGSGGEELRAVGEEEGDAEGRGISGEKGDAGGKAASACMRGRGSQRRQLIGCLSTWPCFPG